MGCVSSTVQADDKGSEWTRGDFIKRNVLQKKKKFLDEYTLSTKLGKGAFAQVHLAHRVSDGAEFAVKITDLRLKREDKESSEDELDVRAKRCIDKEVRTLERFASARHIVQCYGAYHERWLYYIVMERCEMTLLHTLERAPELTEATYQSLFRQMLKALECIHSQRVVHRDVKPDNYLVQGPDSIVKLCDFGLAEVLPDAKSEITGVYGTAPFMAPEMLGTGGYGTCCDIWSAGVMLYTLLFGQFPYIPIDPTAKAMKAAIVSGLPAPSYKPKASLDLAKYRPSSNAMDVLTGIMDRKKATRLSAAGALQLPWFNEDLDSGMPSLRPMLSGAKRAGAFDVRGTAQLNEKDTSLDRLLRVTQATREMTIASQAVLQASNSSLGNLSLGSKDSFDGELSLSKARHAELKPRRSTSKECRSPVHSDCPEGDVMNKAMSGGTQSQLSTNTGASMVTAVTTLSKSSRHGLKPTSP